MRKLLRSAAIVVTLNLTAGLFVLALAQEETVPAQEVARAPEEQNAKVPMCANIQLAATYMPRSARAGGPAFQFAVHNGTDETVSLVMPAPTSAHWYALEGLRWSWRASNGAGGSPVDAMNPRGSVFAFRASSGQNSEQGEQHPPRRLTVAAHGFVNWEVKPADNPVVNFKPSCPHCNHPTDRQFRVVFAYAVLPGNADKEILRCGLRTGPVAVPASYARFPAQPSARNRLNAPGIAVTVAKVEASPNVSSETSSENRPITQIEP